MSTKVKPVLLELVETFFVSLFVLYIVNTFIALPEVVVGASMEPTIHDGERILVEKVSKLFGAYSRGDIVVLNPPGNSKDYIKRIIGLPGDIVKIYNCQVYIVRSDERFVLEEPYLAANTCTYGGVEISEGRSLKLKDDEYLVLGDNRENSADSRMFGVISDSRIVGQVVFRFWPPAAVGFL